MQKYQKQQSKTQTAIKQKIKFIYQHLIKLGYPKILQLSLSKFQQIEVYLSTYFQCTPSRMQLIQWLIAVIYPDYRQMTWYITQKDNLNKIIKALWKIGIMPVNKHTKNLDYKKYVQATIGYQNAVGLIFNLVQLAFQTILGQKSKPDLSFGQFFHQLIDNYTQLVNQNYDLYGITFPCKFVNPNQVQQLSTDDQQKQEYLNEFQKQYSQFYEQKMKPLLERQDEIFERIYANKNKKNPIQLSSSKNKQNKTQQRSQSQLQRFVLNMSKYGRQYNQKYSKLVQKIDNLLQKPQTKSRLIPYYFQQKQESINFQKDKNTIKQAIQKRSIRISVQFCRKYEQYKKILRQIKTPKDDKQFMQKRGQILQKLYQINQNIII